MFIWAVWNVQAASQILVTMASSLPETIDYYDRGKFFTRDYNYKGVTFKHVETKKIGVVKNFAYGLLTVRWNGDKKSYQYNLQKSNYCFTTNEEVSLKYLFKFHCKEDDNNNIAASRTSNLSSNVQEEIYISDEDETEGNFLELSSPNAPVVNVTDENDSSYG